MKDYGPAGETKMFRVFPKSMFGGGFFRLLVAFSLNPPGSTADGQFLKFGCAAPVCGVDASSMGTLRQRLFESRSMLGSRQQVERPEGWGDPDEVRHLGLVPNCDSAEWIALG